MTASDRWPAGRLARYAVAGASLLVAAIVVLTNLGTPITAPALPSRLNHSRVSRPWSPRHSTIWGTYRREVVAVALLTPAAYVLVLLALLLTPVS